MVSSLAALEAAAVRQIIASLKRHHHGCGLSKLGDVQHHRNFMFLLFRDRYVFNGSINVEHFNDQYFRNPSFFIQLFSIFFLTIVPPVFISFLREIGYEILSDVIFKWGKRFQKKY